MEARAREKLDFTWKLKRYYLKRQHILICGPDSLIDEWWERIVGSWDWRQGSQLRHHRCPGWSSVTCVIIHLWYTKHCCRHSMCINAVRSQKTPSGRHHQCPHFTVASQHRDNQNLPQSRQVTRGSSTQKKPQFISFFSLLRAWIVSLSFPAIVLYQCHVHSRCSGSLCS